MKSSPVIPSLMQRTFVPAVYSEFSFLRQKVGPQHQERDRVLPAGKSNVTMNIGPYIFGF